MSTKADDDLRRRLDEAADSIDDPDEAWSPHAAAIREARARLAQMEQELQQWLQALMIAAIMGDDLRVGWAPHPDNYQLRVVYQCDKDADQGPFLAVNAWDISPNSGSMVVRRLHTPYGQKCLIATYIMRIPAGGWDGDERNLAIGEWQIISHAED